MATSDWRGTAGRLTTRSRRGRNRAAATLPSAFRRCTSRHAITPATLVQFVELTGMLGAQHFVFYVGDVSDCLRRVLGAYGAEAVATTIPWAIPPAVAQSTIDDILRHRRLSVFSHVARLEFGVPAHDALRLMVDTYEGRKPMASGAYHRAALATSGSARFRRMPTLSSCYQRCGGPVRAPGLYE